MLYRLIFLISRANQRYISSAKGPFSGVLFSRSTLASGYNSRFLATFERENGFQHAKETKHGGKVIVAYHDHTTATLERVLFSFTCISEESFFCLLWYFVAVDDLFGTKGVGEQWDGIHNALNVLYYQNPRTLQVRPVCL